MGWRARGRQPLDLHECPGPHGHRLACTLLPDDPGWSRTIVASMSNWCRAVGPRDRGGGRTREQRGETRARTDCLSSLVFRLSSLQTPVTIRATGLMKASRAPALPAVTKGRVELPSPYGHDVLSVACLPVAPLGHVCLLVLRPQAGEKVRELSAISSQRLAFSDSPEGRVSSTSMGSRLARRLTTEN